MTGRKRKKRKGRKRERRKEGGDTESLSFCATRNTNTNISKQSESLSRDRNGILRAKHHYLWGILEVNVLDWASLIASMIAYKKRQTQLLACHQLLLHTRYELFWRYLSTRNQRGRSFLFLVVVLGGLRRRLERGSLCSGPEKLFHPNIHIDKVLTRFMACCVLHCT